MTTEQKLKNYILDNYRSVMNFSEKSGIAYTTIISILNKSISRASVTTVIQICDALEINIDELVKGEIVPINKSNDNQYIIKDIFNDLSLEQQNDLIKYAKYLKNNK